MRINYKVSIFAIIFMVLLVMGIWIHGLTVENNQLTENLAKEQSALASAQEELATVQESYRSEVEKVSNLTADLDTANTIIDALKGEEYVVGMTVTDMEIDMLAKTVWGEARGCNRFEQSAVVWCVLNRVDAGWGSIVEVITAPNQFHGYSSNFPVTDEIRELVEDVVARWKLEKVVCGDVGRTLPINYLYFCADDTGIGNVFRDAYNGSFNRWNWDCWNPYS